MTADDICGTDLRTSVMQRKVEDCLGHTIWDEENSLAYKDVFETVLSLRNFSTNNIKEINFVIIITKVVDDIM